MITMADSGGKRKEKGLLQKKANQERLEDVIKIIENISYNYPQIHRSTRNKINLLVGTLKDTHQVNLSVRAANAISTLDELTRNRRTESYIRTILWQIVSNLECVRER